MAARALGLAAVATAVSVTALSGCGSSGSSTSTDGEQSVVTSTTKIAGAGVLGNQRRPDESCAPEPVPVDPGPPEREVRHAAGTTLVRDDPQRIVVLSGDQLDALCALGLQSRIVAAAPADGATGQPSYLGTAVHDMPAVGTRDSPDLEGIRAATPDLILGSEALTPGAFESLSEIAPTVFTGAPGAAWQENLRTVGAATGRLDAANAQIEGFRQAADKTGADNDAAHFQASVVQLTDTTMRVYGAENFRRQRARGRRRGSSCRATVYGQAVHRDRHDRHRPVGLAGLLASPTASSSTCRSRRPPPRTAQRRCLESDEWRKLSATRDNRVFVVNNEVWQTGQGIVAARAILADLRSVNAPIN